MSDTISDVWLGVTILSIVSSTVSGYVAVVYFVERVRSSDQALHLLTEEVRTLESIMSECIGMLQGAEAINSARRSYDMCLTRYYDLMHSLEKLWKKKRTVSTLSRMVRIATWLQEEKAIMMKYDSFRDAVLLLRDLSSDHRAYSTILPMFTALAALVSDEADDEQNSQTDLAIEPGNGHDLHETSTSIVAKAQRKKARRSEVLDLIQSDFNRSIRIIIELEPVEGKSLSKEIIVRTKWDSGSNENAISLKTLRDECMRQDLIKPIEEDNRVEFTWLDGQFLYTPESMVTLDWFTKSDMKKRRDIFYVVPEDAPFDVLIKQTELGKEIKEAMLISFGRHKKKGEKLKEAQEQETKIREAREQVEKRMAEAEEVRQQSLVRRVTGLGSKQPTRV